MYQCWVLVPGVGPSITANSQCDHIFFLNFISLSVHVSFIAYVFIVHEPLNYRSFECLDTLLPVGSKFVHFAMFIRTENVLD